MLRPRLRASAIHLVLSAVVVGSVILVAGQLWYPGKLALAAGMLTMTIVLAAVDVTVGPLLTLILYRPGKKGLAFDLAVVGLLQFAALCYGVASLYQARPAFIVFAVDRFEVVAAAEIEPEQLAQAPEPYRSLSRTGPVLVGAQLPADAQERSRLLLSATLGGADVRMVPRYYVDYSAVAPKGLERAKPIADLARHNSPDAVARALERLDRPQDSVRYFPLSAKDRDLSVLVDGTSGSVLEIVDLRPWG